MTNESSTLFIGHPLIRLESVVSTNTYLLESTAKSTPSEGTAVVADVQTGGKGQFGSSWHSEAGQNLLFSVLLQPKFLPPSDQFMLSRVAALAIYNTLVPSFPDIRIKWPNDIWMGGYKVAGILIQNVLSDKTIKYSVLGIGLNVNQIQFPVELPQAGSLAGLSNHPWDRDSLLWNLLRQLEHQYLRLKRGDVEGICDDFQTVLYQLNTAAMYARPNEIPFAGILRGVNREGLALVEQVETGHIQAYALKEIRFL